MDTPTTIDIAKHLSNLDGDFGEWTSNCPWEDSLVDKNCVYSVLVLGGESYKCRLTKAWGSKYVKYMFFVEVSPEWEDPFQRAEQANTTLYESTGGLFAIVGLGKPIKTTWFVVSCHYGTGLSDAKLALLRGLVEHFAPRLRALYETEAAKRHKSADEAFTYLRSEMSSFDMEGLINRLKE